MPPSVLPLAGTVFLFLFFLLFWWCHFYIPAGRCHLPCSSSALLTSAGALSLSLFKSLFFFLSMHILFSHSFFSKGAVYTPLLYFTPDSGCHLHTPSLPPSRAPVSPRGELPHTSGDSVSVTAMQGTSLDCLALEARWACVPWAPWTLTIQEIVLGKLPSCSLPQRALHREQTEMHLQPFCERGLFVSPRALALGEGLRFETHLEAMEVLLGQGNVIFVLSFCHTTAYQYLPERNTYTYLEP